MEILDSRKFNFSIFPGLKGLIFLAVTATFYSDTAVSCYVIITLFFVDCQ